MKSNRGFSLLETLLYLGIFAIVGGSLFGILTNVVRISTKEVSGDEVASQLNFTMTTLNRLVRESSSIETATTTATTTLKLRMADPAKDPTCVILSGGTLKLAEGPDPFQKQNCTATTTDITTNKVTVDKALFRRAEFPGGHDQALIDIQFSNLATGASKISRALRSGVSRVSAATFDSDLLPNVDAQYEVGSSISGGKRWKNASLSGNLTVAGNVGIGTVSPIAPLQVVGNSATDYTLADFRNTSTNAGAKTSLFVGSDSSNGPYFQIRTNRATGLSEVGNPYGSGDLSIFTGGISNSRIYIQSGGNVGVGTTTPGSKLDVYGEKAGTFSSAGTNGGSYYVSSNPVLSVSTDGSNSTGSGAYLNNALFVVGRGNGPSGPLEQLFRVNLSGNVGIGTTAPGSKLTVSVPETDSNGLAQSLKVMGNTNGKSVAIGANSTYGWIQSHGSVPLYINEVGNNVVINKNAGNVGIGKASPAFKLDVAGNIAATGGTDGTYMALAKEPGSLPGYPSNTYPTLKTDHNYLYFSAGGVYSANMSAGGVWTAVSDKNKKENFVPLNSQEVLEKIGQLPIVEWNYKAENAGIRHIGPFAQDFYQAFKLNGTDDTMISNIDPSGVALVGIQGLLERSKEQQKQIDELKAAIAELKK